MVPFYLIQKAIEALDDAANDCHCDAQFYAGKGKRPDLKKWCEARSRKFRALATLLAKKMHPKDDVCKCGHARSAHAFRTQGCIRMCGCNKFRPRKKP